MHQLGIHIQFKSYTLRLAVLLNLNKVSHQAYFIFQQVQLFIPIQAGAHVLGKCSQNRSQLAVTLVYQLHPDRFKGIEQIVGIHLILQ